MVFPWCNSCQKCKKCNFWWTNLDFTAQREIFTNLMLSRARHDPMTSCPKNIVKIVDSARAKIGQPAGGIGPLDNRGHWYKKISILTHGRTNAWGTLNQQWLQVWEIITTQSKVNGGLLHPPSKDNGNYTNRRTDYVPRGLQRYPEGLISKYASTLIWNWM